MSDLDDITRLGALDEAIRAEERAVARARQRLADQVAKVAKAQGQVDQLASDQKAARTEERALETKLERYGRQLQAALRSLETGVGDPEVSERQRIATLELIDDAETAVLENIEQQEHLAAQQQAAQAELAEVTEHHDGIAAEITIELAERNGRLGGLRTERIPAEEALPADLRVRYVGLQRNKGSAVTTVDKDRCCTKCRMLAAAQQISEVRGGRLNNCRGCGRWLITS